MLFAKARMGIDSDSIAGLCREVCQKLESAVPLAILPVQLDARMARIESFSRMQPDLVAEYDAACHVMRGCIRVPRCVEAATGAQCVEAATGARHVEAATDAQCVEAAIGAQDTEAAIGALDTIKAASRAPDTEVTLSAQSFQGFDAYTTAVMRAQQITNRILQEKMLRMAYSYVYLALDFMATFCYENQRHQLTNEVKTMMVQINKAVAPWLLIFGQITGHKSIRQIIPYIQYQKENTHTIYARVTVTNPHYLYIGETSNFDERTKRHYFETCKHRFHNTRPCKGCRAHACYLKHRVALPHEWITIPITTANNPREGKKIESFFIKTLKPNINAEPKPIWMLTASYAKTMVAHRKRDQKSPFHTKKTTHARFRYDIPPFTTYKCDTGIFYDFSQLIYIHEQLGKQNIKIHIIPGKHDFTKWGRVRRIFGKTTIHEITGGFDPSAFSGNLEDWRMVPKRQYEIICSPGRPDINVYADLNLALDDIQAFKATLKESTEEDLLFYWRVRHALQADKTRKYKARTMIWHEFMDRYQCSNKPIQIRLPYFEQMNIQRVRRMLESQIDSLPWPQCIKNWHKVKLQITTTSPSNISTILCNVTRPNKPNTCDCANIVQRLKSKGYMTPLPHINGHIFFISRDYDGPHKNALRVGANNIPNPTFLDLKRAWERIHTSLPGWLRMEQAEWNSALRKCTDFQQFKKHKDFPSTKDAYIIRKLMNGLVIGPVDKNTNELSFCCPCLYEQAWDKAYNADAGYTSIYPIPFKKKTDNSQFCGYETEETCDTQYSWGSSGDLIKHWHRIYKTKHWNEYAAYNTKGNFNLPYILFKAKNITNHKDRMLKWDKARPIAPQTKHPMKKLFHLTGKAWSFITMNLPGEHFVLNHGGKLTQFVRETNIALNQHGRMRTVIRDIEGCFPNMPKEIIAQAAIKFTHDITSQQGYDSIYVPNRGNKPCQWKTKAKGYKKIPFHVLIDVLQFALHNTIIKDNDGNLHKQVKGIPMGDPHSPGMTICACAWMEQEWMATLDQHTKTYFRAKRYMDDIFMIYVENNKFDHNRFLQDFAKECYLPPLKLEEANPNTFLEMTFEIHDNSVRHWLKNDNIPLQPPKIWRYAHFESHMSFQMKKSTLSAVMKKIHKMASDDRALYHSAIQKIHEFLHLEYPKKMLWTTCTTMGVLTRNTTWFDIRDELRDI